MLSFLLSEASLSSVGNPSWCASSLGRGQLLAALEDMNRTCIALIDATHARLFKLDRTTDSDGVHEELVECNDIVNPLRQETESSHSRGQLFGYDDNSDAHVDELDRVFVQDIVAELDLLVSDPQVQRLIICASRRMLGGLRKSGTPHREGLRVDELPRNLTQLTPPEIRDHLSSYGLLPA